MSYVGNAIKMLIILKSRGLMKIKELSEILEVKERMIRRYKDDLSQCGIYIESKAGKNGGYYITNDNVLVGLNITDKEYISLIVAQNSLKDTKNVVIKEYNNFLDKVNCIYKRKDEGLLVANKFMYTIKNYKSNIDLDMERKILIDIHSSIIIQNKVKITYTSITSGTLERIVRPYFIYQYKGDMYFTGFCELRNRNSDFKISRINSYRLLEDKFDKDPKFNQKEFLENCIGIYKDSELNVKLKIFYPMSQIISEKIWVKNQKIKICEADKSIIYEAKMKGKTEIKSWILGMGSYVKVIEPLELADEIVKEVEKIRRMY